MEFDNHKGYAESKIPTIEHKIQDSEARLHEMRVEIVGLAEKIPPNSEALLKSVKDMESSLRAKTLDDNVRFVELERDNVMLKKKQNLAELEHRLSDKIDDVAVAMTKTLADKFDTGKKFRLMENR